MNALSPQKLRHFICNRKGLIKWFKGLGCGVLFFVLFLLIALVLMRREILNSAFLYWDTKCEDEAIEATLCIFEETGHFPQNMDPALELYVTAFCSSKYYVGRYHEGEPIICHKGDPIKAVKALRTLIEKYPTAFVEQRTDLALLLYYDIWEIMEKDPSVAQKLGCDKNTLMMEWSFLKSIAHLYKSRTYSMADEDFMNGEYQAAFRHWRRRGLGEGTIYCLEYGVGTDPWPKPVVWILKRIGWLLGDFDSHDYWLSSSEYNTILREEHKQQDAVNGQR